MNAYKFNLEEGAKNLLHNCGEVTNNCAILIITEEAGLGYYDEKTIESVAKVARGHCRKVEVLPIKFNPVVTEPDESLLAKMAEFDRVIFFARLGDQLRFRPIMTGAYAIMSYALDGDMLGSDFGQADYKAFEQLKHIVNDALSNAQEIHVTCPEGTDFKGPGAKFSAGEGETTVKRFPVSVFTPIPPVGFSGKIAQVGFLCSTGSQVYEPPACEIKDKVFVHFDNHQITRFEGSEEDVKSVDAHYDHVSQLFSLERNYINSWHAGINPGCAYMQPANVDFDRWGNGAFSSPRVLHFHTCGVDAPGEISINIIDPTVRIDGVAVWEDGRLYPERMAGGKALLESAPQLAAMFAQPLKEVGLGPSGRLEY